MPTNENEDERFADRSEEDRPRRRSRRDDDEDRDDRDEERRDRRRRYDDDDDDRRDNTGGMIPYKNGMALASYYCGVFALIPCVGVLLGALALIFGFMGLSHARKHPESSGKAHAIVGIVLGSLVLLAHLSGVIFLVVMGASRG